MTDLIFDIPEDKSSIIKVIGVGGGGSNAVNQMFNMQVKGVDFVIANTDSQALKNSPVPIKIPLGTRLTEGRGAGNNPAKGKEAAVENLKDIEKVLEDNTKMVFITAGMGGGTGTGAAPVIAEAAKAKGILTVGIVSIPFKIEGEVRIKQAMEGISEMRKYVDALLIINNEKLKELYTDQKFSSAFKQADDILAIAAKGIAEIITVHGYINVDFEDVKTVMTDSGVALLGSAQAEGEDRDILAIKEALNSPLLKDNDIRGAKNILLNIMSSQGDKEMSMQEFQRITEHVQEEVGENANIIWGTGFDEDLGEKINVTVIATGFETYPGMYDKRKKVSINLNSNNSIDDDSEKNETLKSSPQNTEKQAEIEFDYKAKEESTNIECEKEEEQEKEENTVDCDKENFSHMKNLTKLNDDSYLNELENETALSRKKRMEDNKEDDKD